MPNDIITPGLFLKDPDPDKPWADPFKYDIFRKAVGDVAAKTRTVTGTEVPGEARELVKRIPSKRPERLEAQAAIKSFQTQAEVKKQEAEKAAISLSMMGATTEVQMRGLARLQQTTAVSKEKASTMWGEAAGKAEEYVASSRQRTVDALNRLDEINVSITEGRDFAKAHAMNAAVQATVGAMREQEQLVIQRYGVDSKEYQQFQGKQGQTLSVVQSQVETSYRQLSEQQNLTYMNASNELQWKEDMYSSFQEQQHVETLRYLAQSSEAYDLQVSQFQLSIEQLRVAGMENIANWLVQTPVFSMDSQPLVTLLADLIPTPSYSASKVWAQRAQYVPGIGQMPQPERRQISPSRIGTGGWSRS